MWQLTESAPEHSGTRRFVAHDTLSRTQTLISVTTAPLDRLYNGQLADALLLLVSCLNHTVPNGVVFHEEPASPDLRQFSLRYADDPDHTAIINVLYQIDEARDDEAERWTAHHPRMEDIKLAACLLGAALVTDRTAQALHAADGK